MVTAQGPWVVKELFLRATCRIRHTYIIQYSSEIVDHFCLGREKNLGLKAVYFNKERNKEFGIFRYCSLLTLIENIMQWWDQTSGRFSFEGMVSTRQCWSSTAVSKSYIRDIAMSMEKESA